MFMPESSTVALPMMFLMAAVWGSWPACRKMGGAGNAEFELSYVLAQVLTAATLCSTLGMAEAEGQPHFDTATFPSIMRTQLDERLSSLVLTAFGGVLLCLGDFLMACAIELLGVAVACPIGFGMSLLATPTLNYLIEPRADPRLLAGGIACCLVGMTLNAASHAGAGKPEADKAEEAKQGDWGEMESCSSFTSVPIAIDKKWHPVVPAQYAVQVPGGHVPGSVRPASIAAPRPSGKWRVLAVPLMGGVCVTSWGPISTVASTMGKLHPYGSYAAFMVGQALMVVPLVCAYVAMSQSEKPAAPWWVLARYASWACREPRQLFWSLLAGMCVGTGYFIYFVATPVVSRAVGVVFGGSALLTSILWGVFVFKEYEVASTCGRRLVSGAAVMFSAAIGLMSFAAV